MAFPCLCLIVVALVACFCGIPLKAAREVPELTCDNTEAGRHYLADSRGYVCVREDFDYSAGCCQAGDEYSCDTCHEEDKCCSSYEHCVSCCMKPENEAARLLKHQYRIHKHPNTGHWDNPFQFCMGKCRTHKRSTVHENAFIDDRHFCFSDSSRPKTDSPPPEIPAGIQVVAGKKGADCTTSCASKGLFCVPDAMPAIAYCDIMRDHFECEAGCAPNPESKEAPAYVVYGTSKPMYPTMCFITDPALPSGSQSSCTAAQPHVKRLCSCGHENPQVDTIQVVSEAGEDSISEQWSKDDSPQTDVSNEGGSTGDETAALQEKLRGEIVVDDSTTGVML